MMGVAIREGGCVIPSDVKVKKKGPQNAATIIMY